MQYTVALLALAAAVRAQYTTCGWIYSTIGTETVPVPLTNAADCTSTSSASSAAASSTLACDQYVDGQPQCSSVAVPECTEYVDGQPQCATSAAPAPTPECTEYVDGQPQCGTSAAPVTTTPPAPECTEYVDGQPQCGTSSSIPAPACTEYVDGQPQCGTGSVVPSYVAPTGTGAGGVPGYTGPAIATGEGVKAAPAFLLGALGLLALL